MVGALAETDQRDVGTFSSSCRSDVLDIDLASDDLVPECGNDRREQRQTVPPLVRDQNAEVFCFAITHLLHQYINHTPTGSAKTRFAP